VLASKDSSETSSQTSSASSAPSAVKTGSGSTRVRYLILLMLFVVTTVNYAHRATLSIAGPAIAKDFGLDAVAMGYLLSAFGWAYVAGQLPAGWLLDRFGSKKIYGLSLLFWSILTFCHGFTAHFSVAKAVVLLFVLRILLGLAESPAFPANGRIVAAWFPATERGLASAVFNSAQYFALVLFLPVMGWITARCGWPSVFFYTGAAGMALTVLWFKAVYSPKDDPRISPAELDYIERGGALVDMDLARKNESAVPGSRKSHLEQLLGSRMLLGIFFAQYCIATVTAFFLTWFPIYLYQARGMSILKVGLMASFPALCGFGGGIFGGAASDYLVRAGCSLTLARKLPIVAGMLLSVSIIACNYVRAEWAVVVIMALAFLGKGIGALGWAVLSDTAPKQIAGLSGGLFNLFGNISTITTPIAIGYILKGTGAFNGALVFIGAHAMAAIVIYLLVVGRIERLELK